MSGGEQQMLAIGRALMARPKLLCLDEPSMGLAPQLIQQIFSIISEIAEQGTTILVVEQNAQQALSRADRAYVLETGEHRQDRHRQGAAGGRQHPRGLPRRRLRPQRAGAAQPAAARRVGQQGRHEQRRQQVGDLDLLEVEQPHGDTDQQHAARRGERAEVRLGHDVAQRRTEQR